MLCWSESETWKVGFIKGVDKSRIYTLKDLESWTSALRHSEICCVLLPQVRKGRHRWPGNNIVIPYIISYRLRQDIFCPWERVTTNHHGCQGSLFLLLTEKVLFLVSFLYLAMLLSGWLPNHFHANLLHVFFKVHWYSSKGLNNNKHYNDFSHMPDFCNFICQ